MSDDLKNILPSRLFEVTEKAGINTSKQLITLSVWDIKKITNLKQEDILILKKIITEYFCPVSVTGDKIEKQNRRHKTGCVAIDNILSGGFRKGTLTEIYGESGTGKTQLVMQVAAHCDSEGSVIICTEDVFPVKRFTELKKGIFTHDTDCDNLFIEHLTEAQELISCIRIRLPRLLKTTNVSLLILDSVAAPFRCDYTNYVQRAEDLKELGILLYKLAQEHNIAVICVNQVTSTFDGSDNVLPSLGLVWSNMVCYKLKLTKCPNVMYIKDQQYMTRELKVVKAPDLPLADANFVITGNGIQSIQ